MFVVAFPAGCEQFIGPHSLSCLNYYWNLAGCVKEGYDDPSNATTRRNVWNTLNL